jgi:putative transposase
MERYHIVKDVALYYVTFTVVDWLPVFIDETACKIITDSFNFCIRNKFLGVNAYVIMPTHLHAILFDTKFDADRLKHTLDDMRKFTGRRLVDHAALHLPKIYTPLGHKLRIFTLREAQIPGTAHAPQRMMPGQVAGV